MMAVRKARILGLAVAFVAWAAMAADHPNLDATTIRSQQVQIRADAEARKGPYKDLKADQLAKLIEQQDKVEQLLVPAVRKTTELSEVDQIALFNSLETIEAIVNGAEDQRMICERHKPTGSNRPATVCRTVAQRKAEREASLRRQGMREANCKTAEFGPNGCSR